MKVTPLPISVDGEPSPHVGFAGVSSWLDVFALLGCQAAVSLICRFQRLRAAFVPSQIPASCQVVHLQAFRGDPGTASLDMADIFTVDSTAELEAEVPFRPERTLFLSLASLPTPSQTRTACKEPEAAREK